MVVRCPVPWINWRWMDGPQALYRWRGISLQFKRSIILTSIDAGALRGDLGERVLMVELERIESGHRMSERQLKQ